MEARLKVHMDPNTVRPLAMQHTCRGRGWRAPPPPLNKLCQPLPLAWACRGQLFHGLLPGPVRDQTPCHNERRDDHAGWDAAQLLLQVFWLPEPPGKDSPAVDSARQWQRRNFEVTFTTTSAVGELSEAAGHATSAVARRNRRTSMLDVQRHRAGFCRMEVQNELPYDPKLFISHGRNSSAEVASNRVKE
jgi:hypothetical protein